MTFNTVQYYDSISLDVGLVVIIGPTFTLGCWADSHQWPDIYTLCWSPATMFTLECWSGTISGPTFTLGYWVGSHQWPDIYTWVLDLTPSVAQHLYLGVGFETISSPMSTLGCWSGSHHWPDVYTWVSASVARCLHLGIGLSASVARCLHLGVGLSASVARCLHLGVGLDEFHGWRRFNIFAIQIQSETHTLVNGHMRIYCVRVFVCSCVRVYTNYVMDK